MGKTILTCLASAALVVHEARHVISQYTKFESWPTGQPPARDVRPSDPFVRTSRARAHLIYPPGKVLNPHKRPSDRPFARQISPDRLVRPTDPSARLMCLADCTVRSTDPSARPTRSLDRLVRPAARPPDRPIRPNVRARQNKRCSNYHSTFQHAMNEMETALRCSYDQT